MPAMRGSTLRARAGLRPWRLGTRTDARADRLVVATDDGIADREERRRGRQREFYPRLRALLRLGAGRDKGSGVAVLCRRTRPRPPGRRRRTGGVGRLIFAGLAGSATDMADGPLDRRCGPCGSAIDDRMLSIAIGTATCGGPKSWHCRWLPQGASSLNGWGAGSNSIGGEARCHHARFDSRS